MGCRLPPQDLVALAVSRVTTGPPCGCVLWSSVGRHCIAPPLPLSSGQLEGEKQAGSPGRGKRVREEAQHQGAVWPSWCHRWPGGWRRDGIPAFSCIHPGGTPVRFSGACARDPLCGQSVVGMPQTLPPLRAAQTLMASCRGKAGVGLPHWHGNRASRSDGGLAVADFSLCHVPPATLAHSQWDLPELVPGCRLPEERGAL